MSSAPERRAPPSRRLTSRSGGHDRKAAGARRLRLAEVERQEADPGRRHALRGRDDAGRRVAYRRTRIASSEIGALVSAYFLTIEILCVAAEAQDVANTTRRGW